MKFHFTNLGKLNDAKIEINNLTIIIGKNNLGKTYLTTAIYGLLKNLRKIKFA